MKQKRKAGMMLALTLLGLAMAITAAIELYMTPDALQYCALPGDGPYTPQRLSRMRDDIAEALAEASQGGAFSMVHVTESLTSRDRKADATAWAIGEGWLEIYPRFLTWGRRLNETELREGGRVMVMDERLAFQLYGTPMPDNPRIDYLGHSYRVVGTVRHAGSLLGGRGVGDLTDYDFYIPLPTALEDGFEATTEMFSIRPAAGSGPSAATGVEPQFQAAVGNTWRRDGTLINLKKEAMRGSILPRVAFLIFGIYGLGLLFQRVARFTAARRALFREKLAHTYLRRLWPRLIFDILLHMLCYGAAVALAAGLAFLSARPVYIFPEWVPENFVAWSSIARVFQNLTTAAAGLVAIGSRELRIIAFWSGVLRWATVLLLIASAMRQRRHETHRGFRPSPDGKNHGQSN